MNFRIGFGYDVHRLAEGLPFTLGGIVIPHTKGSVGHSDADTLIHAICDALLGAANMRDIGFHFPDTSNDYKGIDSKIILKKTVNLIATKNYVIGNIDSTISLQQPKIKDFIPVMQETLAKVCGIDIDGIAIKATTTEKLGFEGREEGVSANAVVLIYKKDATN
ncbi:MAG: 2-C-methyl-D-erythritol 2,4-cyclodiphosphate synthase [Salinivirgaceae bacterium]|jgi:2-C-methyl-D-erythritol 2,4-cyclodiphosphate synthase|nr:2-C-methyl-D-erythritol 2,4-cyclodiphosphate synthase [Salinivirgaceae bacterium]